MQSEQVVSVGDLKFRIPARFSGGIYKTSISWRLSWPQLEPPSDSDEVLIDVTIFSRRPDPVPAGGATPDEELSRRIRNRNLDGPFLNEGLGLHEYRTRDSTKRPIIYASPDSSYLGLDGQRPYALCQSAGGSPEVFSECSTHGYLSPQGRYRIMFARSQLQQWRTLDESVRNFVVSMVVNDN